VKVHVGTDPTAVKAAHHERPRFAVLRRLSALASRLCARLLCPVCSCGWRHLGCCVHDPATDPDPCSAEAVAVAARAEDGVLWQRSYCAKHAPDHEDAAHEMGLLWLDLRRASARRAA
jgi:hypothetical protein